MQLKAINDIYGDTEELFTREPEIKEATDVTLVSKWITLIYECRYYLLCCYRLSIDEIEYYTKIAKELVNLNPLEIRTVARQALGRLPLNAIPESVYNRRRWGVVLQKDPDPVSFYGNPYTFTLPDLPDYAPEKAIVSDYQGTANPARSRTARDMQQLALKGKSLPSYLVVENHSQKPTPPKESVGEKNPDLDFSVKERNPNYRSGPLYLWDSRKHLHHTYQNRNFKTDQYVTSKTAIYKWAQKLLSTWDSVSLDTMKTTGGCIEIPDQDAINYLKTIDDYISNPPFEADRASKIRFVLNSVRDKTREAFNEVLLRNKKVKRIPVPAHIMKKTNDAKIMGWAPHNLRSSLCAASFPPPVPKTTPSKPATVSAPVLETTISKKRKASSQISEGESRKKNTKTNTSDSANLLSGPSGTQNRPDSHTVSQIRASILVLTESREAIEQALGSQNIGSDQEEEIQELKDQIEGLRMASKGNKLRTDDLQARLNAEIQKNADLTKLYNELDSQRSE